MHFSCPLYRGCPYHGESFIRGSTVVNFLILYVLHYCCSIELLWVVKVVDLKQTAPRAMSLALCSINSLYPNAMVPALITPIFRSPSFGKASSILMLKVTSL